MILMVTTGSPEALLEIGFRTMVSFGESLLFKKCKTNTFSFLTLLPDYQGKDFSTLSCSWFLQARFQKCLGAVPNKIYNRKTRKQINGRNAVIKGRQLRPGSSISQTLTSLFFQDFLSENMTSFQTTSTPSSVSMARNELSMPGTLRWFNYKKSCSNKKRLQSVR